MRRPTAIVLPPALALALAAPGTEADVRLPALVGSHMVLQRDVPARVWGWAEPGEAVAVTIAGTTARPTAGADGRWSVELPPRGAGGPNYMARSAEPGESAWAELREAQARTLSLPPTGMAVANDIGEAGDIHPKNKKDVGGLPASPFRTDDWPMLTGPKDGAK